MSRILALCALCNAWLLAFETRPASAQNLGERFSESRGGYSYRPPLGWTLTRTGESPFRVAEAPVPLALTPHIIIQEVYSKDSLAETTTRILSRELAGDREVEYLANTRFQTDAGHNGIKVAVLCRLKGHNALRIFYVFDAPEPSRKLIICCNAKADQIRQWHALFDRCMSSFSFVPRG